MANEPAAKCIRFLTRNGFWTAPAPAPALHAGRIYSRPPGVVGQIVWSIAPQDPEVFPSR